MPSSPKPNIEICILAGGLSSRMGRDKARLKLKNRTLLSHVRAAAKELGFPVRVIRRDLVPRCGPMGGIYTALKTTKTEAVLFLACDMPFISEELLRKLIKRFPPRTIALFTETQSTGFPFLLRPAALSTVKEQIGTGKFALHSLSDRLHARIFHPSREMAEKLFNVNTPEDWTRAREIAAKGP